MEIFGRSEPGGVCIRSSLDVKFPACVRARSVVALNFLRRKMQSHCTREERKESSFKFLPHASECDVLPSGIAAVATLSYSFCFGGLASNVIDQPLRHYVRGLNGCLPHRLLQS